LVGDEGVGFGIDEVRDRERVPGTSAPPDGGITHDREAEVGGGERVGQHDLIDVVQDEVAVGVQDVEFLGDLRGRPVECCGELRSCLDASQGSQLGVDEQPKVFGCCRGCVADEHDWSS
jgi:hypothetical protein